MTTVTACFRFEDKVENQAHSRKSRHNKIHSFSAVNGGRCGGFGEISISVAVVRISKCSRRCRTCRTNILSSERSRGRSTRDEVAHCGCGWSLVVRAIKLRNRRACSRRLLRCRDRVYILSTISLRRLVRRWWPGDRRRRQSLARTRSELKVSQLSLHPQTLVTVGLRLEPT